MSDKPTEFSTDLPADQQPPQPATSGLLNYQQGIAGDRSLLRIYRLHLWLRISFAAFVAGFGLLFLMSETLHQEMDAVISASSIKPLSPWIGPAMFSSMAFVAVGYMALTNILILLLFRLYRPALAAVLCIIGLIPWLDLLPLLMANHTVMVRLRTAGYTVTWLGLWVRKP